jgi:endonuclease/exonuclease/phosphatase (EEP) superfamily protein YafD
MFKADFATLPLTTLALSVALPLAFGLFVLALLLVGKPLAALTVALACLGLAYLPHVLLVPDKKPATYRLASVNTLITGLNIPAQAAALPHNADVVGLVEAHPDWQAQLPKLAEVFPYADFRPIGRRAGRIVYTDNAVLLSKFPFTFEADLGQGILYRINAPKPFHLLLVHTIAPFTYAMDEARTNWFNELPEQQLPRPLVIMGDFNAVPWDPPFLNMVRQLDMSYANAWLPTYNVHAPAVPIDHILMSPHIRSLQSRRFLVPHTDHFGLLADIQLP